MRPIERGPQTTDDAWICPMCGENHRFSTLPFCLKKALRDRDEAVSLLREIVGCEWETGAEIEPHCITSPELIKRLCQWLKKQENP